MTQRGAFSMRSHIGVAAAILVAYFLALAFLATCYPSTRFAKPVFIGPTRDGGMMWGAEGNVVYSGQRTVIGLPVACFTMREEVIDPTRQSGMHVVATRFSVIAFVLDSLFVSAILAIVVAVRSNPHDRPLSPNRRVLIGLCAVCILVILGLSQVTFVEPIPVYPEAPATTPVSESANHAEGGSVRLRRILLRVTAMRSIRRPDAGVHETGWGPVLDHHPLKVIGRNAT